MKKHILLIALFLFFLACLNSPNPGNNKNNSSLQVFGYLEGKITIGPLCPVVSKNNEEKCKPTEETYKAYPVKLLDKKTKKEVLVLNPDDEGNYKVALLPGEYLVVVNTKLYKKAPETIKIYPNKTTYLNISIDTGIR